MGEALIDPSIKNSKYNNFSKHSQLNLKRIRAEVKHLHSFI